MSENRSILLKSAMSYGVPFGLFWCFKYIFFILGVTSNLFSIIYITLTLFVPFLALFFTWRYKMDIGGKIGFRHAWSFGILLYFFAALIVALLHYIFYRYMAPPEYLANSAQQAIEMLKSAHADTAMIEAVENMKITPIHTTIQGILNNVFYGIIFSVPVAYLAKRIMTPPPPQVNKTDDNNA